MENDFYIYINPMNGLLETHNTIMSVKKITADMTDEQRETACLICGYCKVRVYPFSSPKSCECGNLAVDEEKSTDKVIYLKDHQPTTFTVTSNYKPTFKEIVMNMLKGKNKVC